MHSEVPITISSRAALIRGRSVEHAVATLGCTGLDIDATSSPHLAVRAVARSSVPIQSLWLTGSQVVSQHPAVDTAALFAQPSMKTCSRLVVRLGADSTLAHDQACIAAGYQRLKQVDRRVRIVLALPTVGTLTHLSRLHVVSRLAEEWDALLALDVNADTGANWEAEAAVVVLQRRLAMVRIRSDVQRRPRDRYDLARRTLLAAAEFCDTVTVSILPSPRPWSILSTRLVEQELSGAVNMVQDVFRRVREQSLVQPRLPLS